MNDIVERLRGVAHTYDEHGMHSEIELEAADEIEKLQATLNFAVTSHHEAVNTVISLVAERDTLRAALRDLLTPQTPAAFAVAMKNARTALGEKE